MPNVKVLDGWQTRYNKNKEKCFENIGRKTWKYETCRHSLVQNEFHGEGLISVNSYFLGWSQITCIYRTWRFTNVFARFHPYALSQNIWTQSWRVVTCLSPRGFDFDSRLFRVGFVMDKIALRQICFRMLVLPLSVLFHWRPITFFIRHQWRIVLPSHSIFTWNTEVNFAILSSLLSESTFVLHSSLHCVHPSGLTPSGFTTETL
jgi:hypothetical protein